ncbi:MAG: GntR family transcriptional regulator [Clostridia bacterium]|nr:GntR family transcriptional regulator [Clostridia bacterium]
MEHKIHSLADQVFEQLEQNILSGEYKKGEVFTEMHLSKELGVSRTPIREALRRLEQEYLIELSTKGAKIIGISKKEILDMYEVRIRIEGIASKLAAEVISEEGKKELCDLVELQEFYTQKKNVDGIKDIDSEFHDAVYRHSGSTVFYEILNSLHKKVVKYRKASIQNNERSYQSVKEHRAICDAIVSGDSLLAEKLTIEHIKNARENIASTVKE